MYGSIDDTVFVPTAFSLRIYVKVVSYSFIHYRNNFMNRMCLSFLGYYCDKNVCDLLTQNQRCQNGGTCYVGSDGTAKCLCSINHNGPTCNKGKLI